MSGNDDRVRHGAKDERGLAERISAQIRDWILDGTYGPGEKLPPERRLASLLGVNRGSLRLALKKLEQLGLLQSRQGDGTRVRDVSQAAGIELLPYVFRATLARDPDVLQDVLELRVLLCGYLARLAAVRASPVELDRVHSIIERMEVTTDPTELLALDFDIYWEYARAGRSFVGQLLLNTVRGPFEQNAEVFTPLAEEGSGVLSAARAVAAAVAEGDPEAAERAARRYLKAGAERALGAAGLAPAGREPEG